MLYRPTTFKKILLESPEEMVNSSEFHRLNKDNTFDYYMLYWFFMCVNYS